METFKTGLSFTAFWRPYKGRIRFEFPQIVDCFGEAANQDKLPEAAKNVLEDALRGQLADIAKLPDWPQLHRRPTSVEERLVVKLSANMVIAIQFRRMRLMKGWSQADLASTVGVSQQQIARLEDPDCNPTIDTVSRVARAFDEPLMVMFG